MQQAVCFLAIGILLPDTIDSPELCTSMRYAVVSKIAVIAE